MDLDAIEALCVKSFPTSQRRPKIMARFRLFVRALESVGTSMMLWIGGSFTSGKPEPGDIDLVILLNPSLPVSPAGRAVLGPLVGDDAAIRDTKLRYNVDVRLIPLGHHELETYWKGLLGFDRHDQPKGIIRLRIPQ